MRVRTVWSVTVTVDPADGPHVDTWEGCTPEVLKVMGKALQDAALALSNGDDPNEIARCEWRRRRAKRAGRERGPGEKGDPGLALVVCTSGLEEEGPDPSSQRKGTSR